MGSIYTTQEAGRRLRDPYLRELDHWPVSAELSRVPTREGETFVLISGCEHAPPLVLLHGSGANATTWRGDVAAWSEHFRVHAVDLVGEPGPSAPSRPDLSTEASARWLDDVLSGLGLERVASVGMSLGGWIGLDYAIRRPGRLTRMALGCPAGVGVQRRWRVLGVGSLMLFGRSGRRASARYLTGLGGPEERVVLEAVVEGFAGFRPRTEQSPVFTDAVLRTLTTPVRVTVGERDRMFDSAGTAPRMREHVPHARVRVLPGAGHAVLGQTEPVLEFLRGRVACPARAGHVGRVWVSPWGQEVLSRASKPVCWRPLSTRTRPTMPMIQAGASRDPESTFSRQRSRRGRRRSPKIRWLR